jgi:hypothetical protein
MGPGFASHVPGFGTPGASFTCGWAGSTSCTFSAVAFTININQAQLSSDVRLVDGLDAEPQEERNVQHTRFEKIHDCGYVILGGYGDLRGTRHVGSGRG